MLQEGPGPAQVIGAVARHVRQAPETDGQTGGGLWTRTWRLGALGVRGKTEYPGAEAQMPNGEPGIKHS